MSEEIIENGHIDCHDETGSDEIRKKKKKSKKEKVSLSNVFVAAFTKFMSRL